jgi:protein gp37
MHPDWPRGVRDQCVAAGVPFFFKQRGEFTWEKPERYSEWGVLNKAGSYFAWTTAWNGRVGDDSDTRETYVYKIGKKAAGALLDGREWREFPNA